MTTTQSGPVAGEIASEATAHLPSRALRPAANGETMTRRDQTQILGPARSRE